ncbi:MAG: hypothetical protein GWN58_11585 [Anaerolineae bacterium]|nr:hypothetical protein [Anaerolineae bacterium]
MVTVYPGESIQAAIERAKDGTVICLAEGTWEENLIISKDLTLRGTSRERTIVKGSKNGEPVILIRSDSMINAIITTLTVAGGSGGGIRIGGKAKTTVKNSKISGNEYRGIYIGDQAQATIQNNRITGNGWRGIGMWDFATANIQSNQVLNNGLTGIYMRGRAQATIQDNRISDNGYRGVQMWNAALAILQNNQVSGSHYGVSIGDSAKVNIHENKVFDNTGYGVTLVLGTCGWGKEAIFSGEVRGKGNQMYDNAENDLCPSALRFLRSTWEGCFGRPCSG